MNLADLPDEQPDPRRAAAVARIVDDVVRELRARSDADLKFVERALSDARRFQLALLVVSLVTWAAGLVVSGAMGWVLCLVGGFCIGYALPPIARGPRRPPWAQADPPKRP